MDSVTDLAVKENAIRRGKACPYCGRDTFFTEKSVVDAAGEGHIFLCPPCNAWVGVHPGTDEAFGRLANQELRQWRSAAHERFDWFWQKAILKGASKMDAKRWAYRWLSQQLHIPYQDTHIGLFDIKACIQCVAACNAFRKAGGYIRVDNNDGKIVISSQFPPRKQRLPKFMSRTRLFEKIGEEGVREWCKAKQIKISIINSCHLCFSVDDKRVMEIFPFKKTFHDIVKKERGRYDLLLSFLEARLTPFC